METLETKKAGRPSKIKEAHRPAAEPANDYYAWGRMTESTLKTSQGHEHGWIETIANAVQGPGFSCLTEANKKEMFHRKGKALKPQKFRYQNLKNTKNTKFEGWYGADWPGEPQRSFRLLHGHIYTLPVGLSWKMDKMGSPKRSGLVDTSGDVIEMDGPLDQTHQLIPVGEY